MSAPIHYTRPPKPHPKVQAWSTETWCPMGTSNISTGELIEDVANDPYKDLCIEIHNWSVKYPADKVYTEEEGIRSGKEFEEIVNRIKSHLKV